jgi:hypothetical protein
LRRELAATETPAEELAMNEPRWTHLQSTGGDPRLDAITRVVLSLCQEVETLRAMLAERGLWDEKRYRELREATMLHDHGGPGPAAWQSYSHFKHTLDEEEFLKVVLRFSDEEVARFRQRARERLTMT